MAARTTRGIQAVLALALALTAGALLWAAIDAGRTHDVRPAASAPGK